MQDPSDKTNLEAQSSDDAPRTAAGCDSYTPTWAPDGNLYTLYGDCNGLSGVLSPKRSM